MHLGKALSVLKALAVLLQWEEPARRFLWWLFCPFNNSYSYGCRKTDRKTDTENGPAAGKRVICVAVGDLVEALYHGNCNGTRWTDCCDVCPWWRHRQFKVPWWWREHNVEPQYIKVNGETQIRFENVISSTSSPVTCVQGLVTSNWQHLTFMTSSSGNGLDNSMHGTHGGRTYLPILLSLRTLWSQIDLDSDKFMLHHRWLILQSLLLPHRCAILFFGDSP